ncbi:MAG: hypothetical protein ACE144_12355 [Thermodesulfobacteriota bacterium]
MKHSHKIILAVLLSILTIFSCTTLMGPIAANGQPTRETNISREGGRDPFVLPPGIRLLSRADTVSVSQKVSSKEVPTPSLRVNAILISDRIRLASIDKHIVTIGDTILGEKILEIEKDRVILGMGDKRRTLHLSQSPVELMVEGK